MGVISRVKAKLTECGAHLRTNGPLLTCGLPKGHEKSPEASIHYDTVLKRPFRTWEEVRNDRG